MTDRSCLAIILAAGEGTRMKSAKPKVLHPVAGKPMVLHVVDTAKSAGAEKVALVVGHGGETVAKAAGPALAGVEIFTQEERRGTAHAVLAARAAIENGTGDVLVMFGDTPLVEPETLRRAREGLANGNAVVVVGFRPPNPAGYGRLIEDGGQLVAIREDKDCTAVEKRIGYCNAGLMAIAGNQALAMLEKIGNANAKNEFYLTDIVEVARAQGLKVFAIEAPHESVLGVNTLAELAEAEAAWQKRQRNRMMLLGVTMIAPETVWLAADTQLAPGVVIEQNVVFGPGVEVAAGAVIHAFCHIEGASIGQGATVGPFARLRPGAELAERAKVGNFCEVKKATIGVDAKVNHLTYIGDARIGAGANIGAGTITCNYDGFSKFETVIGAGAFVGSNSALVAPLTIGAGAYVASGSVITDAVPDDALAFGRARQSTLPGKGRQLRERLQSAKMAKK